MFCNLREFVACEDEKERRKHRNDTEDTEKQPETNRLIARHNLKNGGEFFLNFFCVFCVISVHSVFRIWYSIQPFPRARHPTLPP